MHSLALLSLSFPNRLRVLLHNMLRKTLHLTQAGGAFHVVKHLKLVLQPFRPNVREAL